MNFPTLRQNQSTCAACPYSQRPCAGVCLCKQSGRDIREHQHAGDCPLNLFPVPLADGAPVPMAKERPASPCGSKEVWGPKWWAVLHTTALAGKLTPQWVAKYAAALPCPECRPDFAADVAANPLPSDPAQHFAWTWARHDRVRRKLGQPVMTLEDAREKWSTAAASTARAGTPRPSA